MVAYTLNYLCALRLEDLQEFYLYDKKTRMTQKQLDSRNEMKDFIKGKRERQKETARELAMLMESSDWYKIFDE
jgi:hypothetical protein